jgi:hypothetical protein
MGPVDVERRVVHMASPVEVDQLVGPRRALGKRSGTVRSIGERGAGFDAIARSAVPDFDATPEVHPRQRRGGPRRGGVCGAGQ